MKARWLAVLLVAAAFVAVGFCAPSQAFAAALPTPAPFPSIEPFPTIAPIDATPAPTSDPGLLEKLLAGDNATTTNIAILLTVLSLAPSLLIMFTGFTRIIIVLGFLRNAIGTQQMPPNQVLVGLALILTLFVMSPVVDQIYETAYKPMVAEEITQVEAVQTAAKPLSEFMMRQTFPSDMNFFLNAAGFTEQLQSVEDIPFRVLAPAFITSEIKRAFYIGFMLYIPFIVIDMVVASTLMSMGMMMLPPSMISLPFKVLLFVLVDGWQLTLATLVQGFL